MFLIIYLIYLATISIVTFIFYGVDKANAKRGVHRAEFCGKKRIRVGHFLWEHVNGKSACVLHVGVSFAQKRGCVLNSLHRYPPLPRLLDAGQKRYRLPFGWLHE